MPKANKGKRLLNLPDAASYYAFAYKRGVEHGERIEKLARAQERERVVSLLMQQQDIPTDMLERIIDKIHNGYVEGQR